MWNNNKNQIVLNREFNVKVIMLALILHPKSITLEMTLDPGVDVPMMWMIQMVWYVHLSTFKISMLQFLQSGNSDHILEECKKFCHSCQCIFNGAMAHITSGKVKTNMFLIWCGPNSEDIYNNFQLNDEIYDIDYVMEQFGGTAALIF